MTVDDFISKYNNRYIDFDGNYGFQCKDLFSAYNKEVVGNSSYVSGDAWKLYDNAPSKYYDKFLNTPSFVPQKGDVCIWDKSYGGYGHVAICMDGCTTSKLIVMGQNYPKVTKLDSNGKVISNGSPSNIVTMSYNKVKGFLRPKGDDMIPSQYTDGELYRTDSGMVFWHIPNPDVANAYVSNWSNAKPITDAIPPVEKVVEKPVEVIKYVDKPVPYEVDSASTLKSLEDLKKKVSELELENKKLLESIVEPNEHKIEPKKTENTTFISILISWLNNIGRK